jgi:putative molybdopterin biosynthesis protein
LGVRAAANALDLDFIPVEKEEYDLVFRRDFYASGAGQALLAAIRSEEFRQAVTRLGGYDVSQTGTEKRKAESSKRKASR